MRAGRKGFAAEGIRPLLLPGRCLRLVFIQSGSIYIPLPEDDLGMKNGKRGNIGNTGKARRRKTPERRMHLRAEEQNVSG